MKARTIASALLTSLSMTTALTPAGAANMTFERSLNVSKEPQNWLLHHGNCEGYRFSKLKEINTSPPESPRPEANPTFVMAITGE